MGFCRALKLKRSATPSVRPKDGGRKEEVTSALTKQRTRTRTKLSLAREMGGNKTDLASKIGTEKSASTDFASGSPEDQDTLSSVKIEMDIAEDYEPLIVDANDKCAGASTVMADTKRGSAWNTHKNSERYYHDKQYSEAWIRQDPNRLHFIKRADSSSSPVRVRLADDNKSEVWDKFDNNEIMVSKWDQSASKARIKQELDCVPVDDSTANCVGSSVPAQDFQSLSRCDTEVKSEEPGSLTTEPSIKQELLTTEPSIKQELLTAEPSIKQELLTTEPSIKQELLTTEPSIKQELLTAEPSIKQELLTAEPSIRQELLTTEPSVKQELLTTEPSITQEPFLPEHVVTSSRETDLCTDGRDACSCVSLAAERDTDTCAFKKSVFDASALGRVSDESIFENKPRSSHEILCAVSVTRIENRKKRQKHSRGVSEVKSPSSANAETQISLSVHRRYFCEKCCDQFEEKDIFLLHMSSKHPEAEMFPCEDCTSFFLAKHSLFHHRSLAHPHHKAFECHICGNGFDSAEELLQHVRKEKIADLHLVSNH